MGAFVALVLRWRGAVADHVPWMFNAVFLVALTLAVLALVSNALGLGFTRDFGPYLAALLAYLALAGLVFARLLLARN